MSHETSPKVTNFYTSTYLSTSEASANINNRATYRTQSRTSQAPTKPSEMKCSMVSEISSGYIGVLLPICLLAIFLSCVVCVYHWQGTKERRLDLEDDRKRCQRKRTLSEFDSGCALRTFKPVNKKLDKVRSYPWKTTRIQDLPDINNNQSFDIPMFSEMKHGTRHYSGGSYRSSAVVGHSKGCYERSILKRIPIRENTGRTTTGDLSGDERSIPSGPDVSLNLSADTTIESCLMISSPVMKEYPTSKNEVVDEVINKNSAHVTSQGDGQVASVEVIHGPLVEYWV